LQYRADEEERHLEKLRSVLAMAERDASERVEREESLVAEIEALAVNQEMPSGEEASDDASMNSDPGESVDEPTDLLPTP
jgi:hypothetical protein